jgi:hypothetical protein
MVKYYGGVILVTLSSSWPGVIKASASTIFTRIGIVSRLPPVSLTLWSFQTSAPGIESPGSLVGVKSEHTYAWIISRSAMGRGYLPRGDAGHGLDERQSCVQRAADADVQR